MAGLEELEEKNQWLEEMYAKERLEVEIAAEVLHWDSLNGSRHRNQRKSFLTCS